MSALEDLQQPAVRIAYLVEVAGLDVRFWKGAPPTITETWSDFDGVSIPLGDPMEMVYRGTIQSVSGVSSALNPKGGIPKDHGTMRVTLKCGGDWTDDDYDPLKVFGRLSTRGASFVTRLADTLTAEKTSATIEVEDDVSGLTYPRIVHIGQEAVLVTGAAGDGTEGNPWRFTGATRGINGTPIQLHRVSPEFALYPYVTAERVFWESTRVEVWAAAIDDDGRPGEYLQLMNGFLDAEPAIGDLGGTITLTIGSMTALMDGALGEASGVEIGLAQGWHLFEEERASIVAYKARWPKGHAVSYVTDAQSNQGGGEIKGSFAAKAAHTDIFDVTLAADDHPRRGPLVSSGTLPAPPTGYNDINFRAVSPAGAHPSANILEGAEVQNDEVEEIRLCRLVAAGAGSTLYGWPDEVLSKVSRDLSPGTVDGTDGAWADIKVMRNSQTVGGPAIVARLNCDAHRLPMHLRFGTQLSADGGDVRSLNVRELQWFGLSFKHPDDTREPMAVETSGGNLSFEGGWQRTEQLSRGNNQQAFQHYPIRQLPTAFYQGGGERHILAAADLPAAAPLLMRIDYVDELGEERITFANITASEAVADGGGNIIGYKWTISEYSAQRLPSFGDFPGQGRVRMRPAVRWENRSPSSVLLEMLMSGAGGLVNDDTYDNLSYGLNLDPRHVDVASFEGWPVPDWRWRQALPSNTSMRDVADPILKLLGAAVVMRRNEADGRLRLALCSVGPPLPDESRLSIPDRAFVGGVKSGVADEIITQWNVGLNYDEGGEKPRINFKYVDTAAQLAYQRSDSEELKLKGIHVANDDIGAAQALLRRWFGWMRAAFGQKRRQYTAVLPWYRALALTPGDVITINSAHAITFDASKGLNGESVRIMAIEGIPRSNNVKLTFQWRDTNGAGWAPSMRVVSVTDADTVVVEANAYSDTRHPVTGAVQTDASFFAVGDSVQCVPVGDWANRLQTAINEIDGNTISFAVAHGLSVGDNIRPGRWDSVSSVLKSYCYLSDSAGLLGAGDDEGKTYS